MAEVGKSVLKVQPSDSLPNNWLVRANDRVSCDHQMDLQVCGGVAQAEGWAAWYFSLFKLRPSALADVGQGADLKIETHPRRQKVRPKVHLLPLETHFFRKSDLR